MKIGEFSKVYGVSRDTVRHYCKLGLLIPDNRGAQTKFTERECQDMELILRMKGQHFSLQEIRKYIDIKRVSTMVEPESVNEVIQILEQKRYELEQQSNSLMKICASIDDDLAKLKLKIDSPAGPTGVPLRALSLLACPRCQGELELNNASLGNNYVYSGKLTCGCGYEADVKDGIIHTGNLYTGKHDSPDLNRGLYRDVNDDFVVYMQRCTDFIRNSFKATELKNGVVIEGHINGYFFLYNNLSYLDPDCIYIIVDKYPEMLEMYKRNIERLGLRRNIIYIADAKMDWPLKHNIGDMLISFMGDNEHSLYFKSSYIEDVKPFLKNGASVLGASLWYKKPGKSIEKIGIKYPEGDHKAYIMESAGRAYREQGFTFVYRPVGSLKDVKPQYVFECQVPDEEMEMGYFLAFPENEKGILEKFLM